MNSNFDARTDDGLSLIELIVAVVVSGIVTVAIATIFVNSWNAQKDVLSVSEATNRGQLVGSSIEKAVRNAVYVNAPDSETLLVRTSLDGACFGFHIGEAVNDDGDAITTIRTIAGAVPLPATADWSVWKPEIELRGAESSLTKVGTTVEYVLVIETEAAPVVIQGEATQRSVPDSGGVSC
jgi:prepilin-type N-terminal cleavage/methylation domain-containing protein